MTILAFILRNVLTASLKSLTHAVVSSVDLHVLRGAHTGVVAQGVVAGARPTDANVCCALINICKEKEKI